MADELTCAECTSRQSEVMDMYEITEISTGRKLVLCLECFLGAMVEGIGERK